MPEISIVEAKEIIRVIKQNYNYDFSGYSLTNFRYRLDKTIAEHFLKYADILISRLLEDDEFFDEFLFDISSPSTEMFRDTGLYRFLLKDWIPMFNSSSDQIIWFPGAATGNDLFSFLIMLKIARASVKFKIFASTLSQKSIDNISSGLLHNRTLEQSLNNFNEVFPDNDIHTFIKTHNNVDYITPELPGQVSFFKNDLYFMPAPDKVNIIFIRNKLINFTGEVQKNIIDYFIEVIEPGGLIITGYQEHVNRILSGSEKMEVYNRSERIFRKKI